MMTGVEYVVGDASSIQRILRWEREEEGSVLNQSPSCLITASTFLMLASTFFGGIPKTQVVLPRNAPRGRVVVPRLSRSSQ